jgi:hypothetical protein
MTSRQFIRWVRKHESRSRSRAGLLVPLLAAATLAFFVHWRSEVSGPIAASHAWLACTIVAFALAFLRVPFHLYWRSDAAFLAQLPIPGAALFDAALLRCIRAALVTTLVVIAGALPLLWVDAGKLANATTTLKATPIAGPPPGALSPSEFVLRHSLLAGALGVVAAFLLPAVATWAATLVRRNVLDVATTLGGAPTSKATPQNPGGSAVILGALPGFASTVIIVLTLLAAAWLENAEPILSPAGVLVAFVGVSIVAVLGVRQSASRVMGDVLRDVSALDRQQLATLEIRPPTALERAIGKLVGADAGLVYRKDARLMRRRYPMAFALGGLAFGVLVIIGLARPGDPTPWLVVVLGGTGLYAIALAGRLFKPPIELVRLAATLPIRSEARTRAKVAWVVTWLVVFVVVPLGFAVVRLL